MIKFLLGVLTGAFLVIDASIILAMRDDTDGFGKACCENCKHWFDNGSDIASCDCDALLRERDFLCANWEAK